jgi:8-oxo-dGTP pyrophosphatase MutT (NUDIX family)
MSLKARITVAAVVERAGRFLFVEERIARRLVLNQPAGHVEDGETLLAAVIRETREETAWKFEPQALLGIYLWRNPSDGVTTLRFGFAGQVTDHDARQRLDTGIARAIWLSRDELLVQADRLRSPLVLRSVDDYLRGQRQSLDAIAHLDVRTAEGMRTHEN